MTAYLAPEGHWTLGWGRGRGVSEHESCTQAMADQMLEQDLDEFEKIVSDCICVQLTENQFSAFVSFVFNVGVGSKGIKDGFKLLKSGEPSTMLKLVNEGDFKAAAEEFPKWDKVNGVHCPGVLRRRMAEQSLFLK